MLDITHGTVDRRQRRDRPASCASGRLLIWPRCLLVHDDDGVVCRACGRPIDDIGPKSD